MIRGFAEDTAFGPSADPMPPPTLLRALTKIGSGERYRLPTPQTSLSGYTQFGPSADQAFAHILRALTQGL